MDGGFDYSSGNFQWVIVYMRDTRWTYPHTEIIY